MTDVFAPQSPADNREFVKSFASDGTANFERVEFTDLDFSAVFGKITNSTTQNSVAYGIKGFTLDEDNGSIKVGYPLQCLSLDDPDCFMQGVVVLKDQTYSPAYIEVAITIISPVVNTTNNWELSVIPLAGFSINPSATVGISTTSIDASGAGPFTFTTQTGKLFMQQSAIGGTVICTALADPSIYLFARIEVISGTSLIVSKIYSNATSSVSSWSIQMFDGPDRGIPFYSMSGMTLAFNTTNHSFDFAPGSVMDSTNSVLMTLDSTITKSMESVWAVGTNQGGVLQSAFLSGTISKDAATTITGVGTTFTADFSACTNNDYIASGGSSTQTTPWAPTLFTTGGQSLTYVSSVVNNTSMNVGFSTAGAVSNKTYKRGGLIDPASNYGTQSLFIALIIRKDSDGSIDAALCSLTPSGEPDLPAGYSKYRSIGAISIDPKITASLSVINIFQPLLSAPAGVSYITVNRETLGQSYQAISSTTNIVSSQSSSPKTFEYRRAALTGDVTASQNSNATTIAANAVTNTKLNDMAAYTLKGRNAGTTGDPSDIDITALTEQASPTTTDFLIGVDTAASNAFKKYSAANFSGGAQFPMDMGSITEAATITFDAGTVP